VSEAQPNFENGPDFVQSLSRGLMVMRAFDADHAELSQSEIAERTGLARAVVRRSLLTLQHLSYVGARGRRFFLTPRVLELGFGYLSSLRLPELARPAMEQLAHSVQESCSMSVLDGTEIVYVARVPVKRVITIALGVGARLPAYTTSMGRILLAGLADPPLDAVLAASTLTPLTSFTLCKPKPLRAEILRVRQQGYCLVMQELELGLCSIAVPLRDRRNTVIAALNVGMQYNKDSRARALQVILPALQQTSAEIERAIAHQWAPHPAEGSAK
jgi:IclR family transcriptional regulator, pca regulon regulatory protein